MIKKRIFLQLAKASGCQGERWHHFTAYRYFAFRHC